MNDTQRHRHEYEASPAPAELGAMPDRLSFVENMGGPAVKSALVSEFGADVIPISQAKSYRLPIVEEIINPGGQRLETVVTPHKAKGELVDLTMVRAARMAVAEAHAWIPEIQPDDPSSHVRETS